MTAAAALLRGLCINLTGAPVIVISAPPESGTDHLLNDKNVFTFELSSSDSDKEAAEKIRSTYLSWSGTIVSKAGSGVVVPSCAIIKLDNALNAIYWTGADYDSAVKCKAERGTEPCLIPAEFADPAALPNDTASTGSAALISFSERSKVVKNKIALITGGAQGIGEEIARNLASLGAFVYIADLNLSGAEKLAKEINESEKHTAAFPIAVNVADEVSVEAMFNTVLVTTGGLDLCISNAGVLRAGSVLEQPLEDFKFVTDINYTAFFVISKFAGRLLKCQHLTAPDWKTDIVQINSKSGLEGSNKNGAYAGGKFGGIGLVASFAMELVEYNIKVNAICPGNFLDGALWSDPEKGLFVQYLNTGKVPGAKTVADVRAAYEARVPMKRGCTGRDLVRALLYIVEQEYETGQAIPVTGGQIMLH